MDFQQQTLRLCENIRTMTGVYCTLMDSKQQCKPLFPCQSETARCLQLHSAGCTHAIRWNETYMYRCAQDCSFLVFPLRRLNSTNYSLLAGPFVAGGNKTAAQSRRGVPVLTEEKIRALSEIIQAVCGYLSTESRLSVVESEFQHETLHSLYDIMRQDSEDRMHYPIDEERRLRQLIQTGDKNNAQQLLNQLLLDLYMNSGNDLLTLKNRVRELITLMSRAAMDGGADVDEIMAMTDRSIVQIDHITDFDALDILLGSILHRFCDRVFDFSDVKHQTIIRQASSYIQEHLCEKLTLEQVAGQVHLSKSYFCRILKEELGCTFTEYTNRLRIERSKTYLRHQTLSLSEIAYKTGFDDQSYFTRIFKRYVGMPPGKYRANAASA